MDLIRRHRPTEVPGDEDVAQLLTREPTPEEAAELADECRRLLDSLQEPELRQIALWKVEGYTHEEIAARLDCVPRTIERKVSRIACRRHPTRAPAGGHPSRSEAGEHTFA